MLSAPNNHPLNPTVQNAPSDAIPVDADKIGFVDVSDNSKTKSATFTALKAFLKTYFDTLYGGAGSFTGGTLTSALNYAPEVAVASATSTEIGAATSNVVRITGTTDIVTFDAVPSGVLRYVRFTGSLVLYHGAGITLPGETSIMTNTNDTAIMVSLNSSEWLCISYVRSSGQVLVSDVTKLSLSGGTLTGQLNYANYVNIASATTTPLSGANSNLVKITGGVTITGLGSIAAGAIRFVRFEGALTLTHNATSLILPTGANITTEADDTAVFVSLGSGNWLCISYQRKSGQALVASTASGSLLSITKLTATTSSTYTTPAGCNKIKIRAVGGGGGGGGANGGASQSGVGGGGGSGGYLEKTIAVTPSTGYTYQCGTAGAAGTAGNNSGGNAGSSTITISATTYTASGGGGGTSIAAGTTAASAPGGGGGTGTNGDINISGRRGGTGIRLGYGSEWAGYGADSMLGSSDLAYALTNAAGVGGNGYGAGGSGGCAHHTSNYAGGAGTHGTIIIEEYS